MTLVDTSVWSLAFRRRGGAPCREALVLDELLRSEEALYLTGIIVQETLQGISSPEVFARLAEKLDPVPLLDLGRRDYVFAAEIWNRCRRAGVQLSLADAQIAAAAIHHGCALLTADRDFARVAELFPLRLL